MPTLTKIITEFSSILEAPNKNCSRQHFNFLLLSFKFKIRLAFSKMCFGKILCEDAPVLQYKF